MYPKGDLRPVEKVRILNTHYDSACQLHRPEEPTEQVSEFGCLLSVTVGAKVIFNSNWQIAALYLINV